MTDLFAYCAERIPRWNTISISGYHIREAGSTAVQEIAFTLANGIAYCEAAVAAGLDPTASRRASRSSSTPTTTSSRRWRSSGRRGGSGRGSCASRFGVTNPKALALRFHTQTGGSTLTAQQPEVNVVRVALQALAAVLGGTQSLHTNGVRRGARASVGGAADARAADAAGDRVRDRRRPRGRSARRLVLRRGADARARGARAASSSSEIDEIGGAVAAIEPAGCRARSRQPPTSGRARSRPAPARSSGSTPSSTRPAGERIELHRLDPVSERRQVERTRAVRAARDPSAANAALEAVRGAARGAENMLPPIRSALAARCTVGEVCGVLREEWGEHDKR